MAETSANGIPDAVSKISEGSVAVFVGLVIIAQPLHDPQKWPKAGSSDSKAEPHLGCVKPVISSRRKCVSLEA